MNVYKNLAKIAGILLIIGTAAGILSLSLSGSINDPNYLVEIAAKEDNLMLGSFLQFIMGIACAGIGISLYPVVKKFNEGLAFGSGGFRIIEGMLHIVGAVILFLLLVLSQEFINSGDPASSSSSFQTLGVLMLAGRDLVGNFAILSWCIGAMMYYSVFYQTKLIPRWLSGWGLAGVTLSILSSILLHFQLISPLEPVEIAMNVPIALQEMVLAVWLIIKGFNPMAFASAKI